MTDHEYQALYDEVYKELVTMEMRSKLAKLTEHANEPAIEELKQQLAASQQRLEAVEREIDRWRHGNTIEGDFVCPNELDAVNLRAEVAASQQEAERLRALLARMKRFADDGVDALEESGEDAEECAEYRDTIAHIAQEGGADP